MSQANFSKFELSRLSSLPSDVCTRAHTTDLYIIVFFFFEKEAAALLLPLRKQHGNCDNCM